MTPSEIKTNAHAALENMFKSVLLDALSDAVNKRDWTDQYDLLIAAFNTQSQAALRLTQRVSELECANTA